MYDINMYVCEYFSIGRIKKKKKEKSARDWAISAHTTSIQLSPASTDRPYEPADQHAHSAALQLSSGLLKEGHRAIFKIDGNAQSALDRFPLQLRHLLSIQRHRLLQQQVLSRLQGLQSQRMTRLRWCGDDHRVNGWIGQQRIPVGMSLES